jgi:hypothetical protein
MNTHRTTVARHRIAKAVKPTRSVQRFPVTGQAYQGGKELRWQVGQAGRSRLFRVASIGSSPFMRSFAGVPRVRMC